ncbi:unnamed protein product [Soboliphyme baturini]|uniref:Adiponectin receptor protein n=1 Tax=Soboliphyme baturini TaxID=241478 RepID=A0A183IRQ1_9BILA|nr:unnamed protein product [Soboliphyme baturini]
MEITNCVNDTAEYGTKRPPQPFDIIVKRNCDDHSDGSSSKSDNNDDEYVDASDQLMSDNRVLSDGTFPKISPPAWMKRPENRGDSMEIHYEQRVEYESCDEELEMDDFFCFPSLDVAKEQAGQFVKKVWEASWKATHFYSLPEWLQDNDFLYSGHRPPLPSFNACFKSIFRLHTETGNIWSHMLGCAAFVGTAIYFLTRPEVQVQWQEKLVFSSFFLGAISCLGLSSAFHTVSCHSERVGKIFSKLDYCGISLLIMGSFVPWLFYGFYCRREPKIVYIILILLFGTVCVTVSLWDEFSTPRFRPVRAGLFMGLGLSGIIPCVHYFITDGFWSAVYEASLGWLLLMAVLYIGGALLYAWRIPERFFPGKCDIWFQSHQIFHLCVVMAAFVHYHGINEMAVHRLSSGSCEENLIDIKPLLMNS